MRSPKIRWLIGSITFLAPLIAAVFGLYMDRSELRNNPTYAFLVPLLAWGSVIGALIIPPALILISNMPFQRKLIFIGVVLAGLFVQTFLVINFVLLSIH